MTDDKLNEKLNGWVDDILFTRLNYTDEWNCNI